MMQRTAPNGAVPACRKSPPAAAFSDKTRFPCSQISKFCALVARSPCICSRLRGALRFAQQPTGLTLPFGASGAAGGNAQGNLAAQIFRIHRTLQGIPQRFPVLLLRIKRVKKFYLICTFHASRVYNADVASQNLSIYDCCRLKDKSAFGVVDTAYDGLIYRQAQADSLATALRCWSSRLCA